MTNEKIIPFTVDEAVDEVNKMQELIDKLLTLGNSINGNRHLLESVTAEIRKADINSNFVTFAEIAEALHCQPVKVSKLLKNKGVPIIDAGKTYVVSKRLFLKAFCESEYEE